MHIISIVKIRILANIYTRLSEHLPLAKYFKFWSKYIRIKTKSFTKSAQFFVGVCMCVSNKDSDPTHFCRRILINRIQINQKINGIINVQTGDYSTTLLILELGRLIFKTVQ